MTTDFDAATQLHLKKELESLQTEFEGMHPPERVAQVMTDSIERLRKPDGVEQFLPALASRLCRERLRAAGQSEGAIAKDVPEVLFVSLSDMGRAQIAAAVMRNICGGRVSVHSAGSGTDTGGVDQNVKVALEEIGIDLDADAAYAKPLTNEVLRGADVIVTMGRSVGQIDVPPGVDYRDWRIGDPRGAALDEVRRVRADIEARVRTLLEELAGPQAANDTKGAQ